MRGLLIIFTQFSIPVVKSKLWMLSTVRYLTKAGSTLGYEVRTEMYALGTTP